MNHSGDTNKMVDTPRTDAVQDELINQDTYTSWLEMSQTARQLERELNAANAKIKRMEEAGDKMEEWLIWSFGPQFKRHTTALAWIKSKESKS